MWRYLAGAVAALLLAAAGILLFNSRAANTPLQPLLPAQPQAAGDADAALPDTVPEASAKTREERRFARVDKDKNGSIARAEYLAPRRKAFARLDTDGNGALSFDEWAIKATTKFAGADADKSGTLTPTEFATTAVVRKPRPKAKCVCPPVAAPVASEEDN